MKVIRLHGWLGKQFGKRFEMAVSSPVEAIRALCSQLKGLEKALADDENGFTIWSAEMNVTKDTLAFPFSDNEVLHIVPVVSGAKDGVGQILLGIVLLAAAFFTMGTSLLGQGLLYEAVMTGLTTMGTSLILGGISQLLFAPPKAQSTEKPENRPSYNFNGAVNTVQQGNCVPLLYGELIHGSQVVSAGMYVEDVTA
jgi:predicted phage tail protein